MASPRKKAAKPRHTIEVLEATPYLDMEQFMLLSQSRRLETKDLELADRMLVRWADYLHARRINAAGESYLLIWLDKFVEDEVNATWESSPSQAFTMNSLAQAILMAAVREHLPHVATDGCAPVPRPSRALREALDEVGIRWEEHATLSRQYAMLTPMGGVTGCGACYLKKECPRMTLGEIFSEDPAEGGAEE
ncbi:hypothetical protein [Oceanidesulfovibrio marinus]|uniref:Uncharacterized protein n=1 Tax=Oceanidesulfovibrio marinus TaxID=370038 RepID=A0ABX6NDK6_9BACT|nr:hypothetical protein [Oceanidesulfovibrio marinus]QJT08647.1 hypothetical protein E8L03_06785 [Oceanidesulfovibrio marinus]